MQKALIQLEQQFNTSVITQVVDPWLTQHGIELWIKRDDLLHPIISGNKWRKLKYILDDALSNSTDTLISMGGAYSNHLHALAYTGLKLGIKTQAFIRGERPDVLNPTLLDLQQWAMQLTFVSRTEYRQLRHYQDALDLPGLCAGQYWLPEGGAVTHALAGVKEIIGEIDRDYDTFCVPCGTGTTLAGLMCAVPAGKKVLGFAALKGAGFLNAEVSRLIEHQDKTSDAVLWSIKQDYHFGGFAKSKPALQHFIESFEASHKIPLEPIYTGKMLYGIYALIKQGYFKTGERILALHTGGLQGKR